MRAVVAEHEQTAHGAVLTPVENGAELSRSHPSESHQIKCDDLNKIENIYFLRKIILSPYKI
jgi:hypothetical protein